MDILNEIHIFIKNIAYWIFALLGSSLFFFLFGLKQVEISGRNFLLPILSSNSFSVEAFLKIRHDLLPPGVQLITTNPMSAVVSQILFSLLLGFLITVPVFIYEVISYLNPALLPHEKKVVLWSLIPFVVLFFSGCLFSYFYLIPATFRVLYPFATVMGANPLFSLDEFIYYIIGLMVSVGVMFLLPLFMILLSYLRIIRGPFWQTKWRYALLLFLILSAIITPDGSGITMIMLFLPLGALYFAGCFFAVKFSKDE